MQLWLLEQPQEQLALQQGEHQLMQVLQRLQLQGLREDQTRKQRWLLERPRGQLVLRQTEQQLMQVLQRLQL